MHFGEEFGDTFGDDIDRTTPYVISDTTKTRAIFKARRELQDMMRRLRQRMPFNLR